MIPTPTPTPTDQDPSYSISQSQPQPQPTPSSTFKSSQHICRFITTDPIPQLKATVSIQDNWLISSLIEKIQSTIISETSNLDFNTSISSSSPTHRLILEQDGTRLPSNELCSIVDRAVIICVQIIPNLSPIRALLPSPPFSTSTPINPLNQSSRLIPNLSVPLNHRLICASLPQLSSNLPTPSQSQRTQETNLIPKIEDSLESSFVRSHIEAFRKSAARHYQTSSDSSSHSPERRLTETGDEEEDYKPKKKKIRFDKLTKESSRKKSRRSSTMKVDKGKQRDSSCSITPEISRSSSSPKENMKRSSTLICVKIPYVETKKPDSSRSIKPESPKASPSESKPIILDSSSSNKFPITPIIRSSKRSIYEIYMTDLTFKAASSQGPLRIPPSNQGLNPSCTITQLSKHLRLEKHQSWKIKIGSKFWINHRDHDHDQESSVNHEMQPIGLGNQKRRSTSDSTMVMKDWDLSLGILGVSPLKLFKRFGLFKKSFPRSKFP
ncbi:uncharacterized protein MELLADRAFT_76601, partial [Melampsora larici-populina 98AG31]